MFDKNSSMLPYSGSPAPRRRKRGGGSSTRALAAMSRMMTQMMQMMMAALLQSRQQLPAPPTTDPHAERMYQLMERRMAAIEANTARANHLSFWGSWFGKGLVNLILLVLVVALFMASSGSSPEEKRLHGPGDPVAPGAQPPPPRSPLEQMNRNSLESLAQELTVRLAALRTGCEEVRVQISLLRPQGRAVVHLNRAYRMAERLPTPIGFDTCETNLKTLGARARDGSVREVYAGLATISQEIALYENLLAQTRREINCAR